MITFGLTGGIACGKSTVTKTLRAENIPMVDADIVAREVVVPGSVGLKMIVDQFGPEYVAEDGTLDRGKLAATVFSNQENLIKIGLILNPLIQAEADVQIERLHKEYPIVGYDAALICEQGNASRYRPLIVVSCPPDVQLARLMKRNSVSQADAMARIEAQMPLEQKVAMADYVIDTSDTIEHSVEQTMQVITKLRSLLK
jgi:dephospho-CoA kinase